MQVFKYGALALIAISGGFLTAQANDSATALQINQGAPNYVGKSVKFTGKVDRVISPGSFIVSDAGGNNPNHRILVVTSTAGVTPDFAKQQAGVAGVNLKEGDHLTLNGKVEKLAIQSDIQRFSPGSDYSENTESTTTFPVLVIKPGDAQKMS